jgi:hypothetical protein
MPNVPGCCATPASRSITPPEPTVWRNRTMLLMPAAM